MRIISLEHEGKNYSCDLSQPIDISIPIGQVKCFYATDFEKRPYTSGDFIGSVNAGAPVNFYDVIINPHGNGTHTECLGHITKKQQSVNDHLSQFHFMSRLVTVEVTTLENEDRVLTKEKLKSAFDGLLPEALILRTSPNSEDKLTQDYSGTNPPYLTKGAMEYILKAGVRHLLLDLPSVDREEDEGKLATHHMFWNVRDGVAVDGSRANCTITELIYVADEITDGLYLLNIQIPALELDAAPSKPVIYAINEIED